MMKVLVSAFCPRPPPVAAVRDNSTKCQSIVKQGHILAHATIYRPIEVLLEYENFALIIIIIILVQSHQITSNVTPTLLSDSKPNRRDS